VQRHRQRNPARPCSHEHDQQGSHNPTSAYFADVILQPSRLSKTLQIGLSDALSALVRMRVVNQSFVSAVEDLRALRDKVAHGKSTPTQPEGIAFVTSSWELVRAAKALAIVFDLQGGHTPNRQSNSQKPGK